MRIVAERSVPMRTAAAPSGGSAIHWRSARSATHADAPTVTFGAATPGAGAGSICTATDWSVKAVCRQA